MTQALNHENGGLGNAGTWVIGQVIMVTLALVWVWLAGLRFLWRSDRPLWRALAWAYALLFVLFAVTTGAKIYYLAGTYPYLLAAGFVSIDGWLAARPGRVRNLMLATALTIAAALPIVLPVLPAADVGWTATISGDSAESIGWPQLVQTVHTVWLSLPPAQRAHAVIFTATNRGGVGSVGTGSPTAAAARPPGSSARRPASGIDVPRQRFPQRVSILSAQVDLILRAVQPEAHRGLCLPAIEVIYKQGLDLLCHPCTTPLLRELMHQRRRSRHRSSHPRSGA